MENIIVDEQGNVLVVVNGLIIDINDLDDSEALQILENVVL